MSRCHAYTHFNRPGGARQCRRVATMWHRFGRPVCKGHKDAKVFIRTEGQERAS